MRHPRASRTLRAFPSCAVGLPASSSITNRTPTPAAAASCSCLRPSARRAVRTTLPSWSEVTVDLPDREYYMVTRGLSRLMFPVGNNRTSKRCDLTGASRSGSRKVLRSRTWSRTPTTGAGCGAQQASGAELWAQRRERRHPSPRAAMTPASLGLVTIVHTKARKVASVLVTNFDRPCLPPFGENGGFDRHPVHVEAKRLVELGQLSQSAVDGIHPVSRTFAGVPKIPFNGCSSGLCRCFGGRIHAGRSNLLTGEAAVGPLLTGAIGASVT